MKLYIAGPVTGMPDDNLLAFQAAAWELEDAGYEAIMPHGFIPVRMPSNRDRRLAIAKMMKADGIAMLPGWENSTGARLERHIASHVDIPSHTVDQWATLAVEGLL